MHRTNQKLEGNVRDNCVKSLHLRKIICSVLLYISIREMF